jgi:hypothetical protein
VLRQDVRLPLPLVALSRRTRGIPRHRSRPNADAVVIKEGEPFFLCPPDGQIDVSGSHGFGLYHHDTRFLSGYELTVAGAKPSPLASTAVTGGVAMLELTTPEIDLGGRPDARQGAPRRSMES